MSTKGFVTQYTPEFKQSVMTYRREHGLSLLAAANLFNIPSPSTIYIWEQRYNSERVATGRLIMTTPTKQVALTSKPIESLTPEEMAKELHYLRVENAYLKKLEALVQ